MKVEVQITADPSEASRADMLSNALNSLSNKVFELFELQDAAQEDKDAFKQNLADEFSAPDQETLDAQALEDVDHLELYFDGVSPLFDAREVENVVEASERAGRLWRESFDDKNTLNDWVTYICMYSTNAARFDHIDDPSAQYDNLIKAAGLALAAAARVRKGSIANRHYDPK